MRYRDDLTPAETATLLDDVDALDAAYAAAGAEQADDDVDQETRDGAHESTLAYVNRYIAGDR